MRAAAARPCATNRIRRNRSPIRPCLSYRPSPPQRRVARHRRRCAAAPCLRSGGTRLSRENMRVATGIRVCQIREVQASAAPSHSRPFVAENARIDASPPGVSFWSSPLQYPDLIGGRVPPRRPLFNNVDCQWAGSRCTPARRLSSACTSRAAARPRCGRGVQRQHMSTPCSESGFDSRRPHHLHRTAHGRCVVCCPMKTQRTCGGAAYPTSL